MSPRRLAPHRLAPHRLERVHAYVCVDPADDNEGFPVIDVPMFIGDERNLDNFKTAGTRLRNAGRMPKDARLTRFAGRVDLGPIANYDFPETPPQTEHFRIQHVYAFIGTDPATGDEAIPGLTTRAGTLPFIAADHARLCAMLALASDLQDVHAMALVCFTTREDAE